MGYSDHIPRVTGHGACKEGGSVINEVGYDEFHKVLRELRNWRRTSDGGLRRGVSVEGVVDFRFASVPNPVRKQLNDCGNDNRMNKRSDREQLVKSPVSEDVGVFIKDIADLATTLLWPGPGRTQEPQLSLEFQEAERPNADAQTGHHQWQASNMTICGRDCRLHPHESPLCPNRYSVA